MMAWSASEESAKGGLHKIWPCAKTEEGQPLQGLAFQWRGRETAYPLR